MCFLSSASTFSLSRTRESPSKERVADPDFAVNNRTPRLSDRYRSRKLNALLRLFCSTRVLSNGGAFVRVVYGTHWRHSHFE